MVGTAGEATAATSQVFNAEQARQAPRKALPLVACDPVARKGDAKLRAPRSSKACRRRVSRDYRGSRHPALGSAARPVAGTATTRGDPPRAAAGPDAASRRPEVGRARWHPSAGAPGRLRGAGRRRAGPQFPHRASLWGAPRQEAAAHATACPGQRCSTTKRLSTATSRCSASRHGTGEISKGAALVIDLDDLLNPLRASRQFLGFFWVIPFLPPSQDTVVTSGPGWQYPERRLPSSLNAGHRRAELLDARRADDTGPREPQPRRAQPRPNNGFRREDQRHSDEQAGVSCVVERQEDLGEAPIAFPSAVARTGIGSHVTAAKQTLRRATDGPAPL